MRPLFDVIEALEAPKYTAKLKRHFRWTKEQVTGLKTRSVMKGRTNSPKGKDGLRSGVCIFNEIHQYENYANINVFTTGLGKKKHGEIEPLFPPLEVEVHRRPVPHGGEVDAHGTLPAREVRQRPVGSGDVLPVRDGDVGVRLGQVHPLGHERRQLARLLPGIS